MPSYIIRKAVNLIGTVARDIRRIKRNAFNLANKKSDASLYLQCTKIAVAFVFLAGTLSFFGTESFNNITPMHASADEEVRADRNNGYTNNNELFFDSKLQSALDAPEDTNENPMGGAVDPTIPTTQGSVILASKMPVMPEASAQKRSEITEYVVKPGDTASSIARRFGLKLETLLWSNDFRSPNYITPGQTLVILPTDGLLYEVRQGDTLSTIATRHNGSVTEILDANEIESETHIFAGQTLIIPGGSKPAPQRATTPRTTTPAPRYASSPRNLDSQLIHPTGGVGRITQWLHRTNAVDIANSCGTPIYAAASGVVGISVGNGLWNGGFGNYITVNHNNGTRTLYAHLMRNLVWSGQTVQQGQVIGYMGGRPGMPGAGRSTGCHVHWEVHGARNPLAY